MREPSPQNPNLNTEERARAARHAYMSRGAEVGLGHIPLLDLKTWIGEVEPMDWRGEPYVALDIGWLYFETAFTILTDSAGSAQPGYYSPERLIGHAKGMCDTIKNDLRNDVLVRSRAEVASSAMDFYANIYLSDDNDSDRFLALVLSTYAAAKQLHKAYEKHGDTRYVHDLHLLEFFLIINSPLSLSDVALPVPTRFQEEQSNARADMSLLRRGTNHSSFYKARITTQTSREVGDLLYLQPTLLEYDDGKYQSELGLEAMDKVLEYYDNFIALATHRGDPIPQHVLRQTMRRQRRLDDLERLEPHLNKLSATLRDDIKRQIDEGVRPSFETDPMTGLDAAREWYAGLEPHYFFTEADIPSLEQCMNPYEIALAQGEATLEDVHNLSWLRTDFALLTGDPGDFERADELFDATAEMADEQENWSMYCDAKIGKATAALHRALRLDSDIEPAMGRYAEDLRDMVAAISNGLKELDPSSPHMAPIQEMRRRVIACLPDSMHR